GACCVSQRASAFEIVLKITITFAIPLNSSPTGGPQCPPILTSALDGKIERMLMLVPASSVSIADISPLENIRVEGFKSIFNQRPRILLRMKASHLSMTGKTRQNSQHGLPITRAVYWPRGNVLACAL